MKKIRKILLLTGCVMLCQCVGWGATYYLDAVNGDDSNAGTSSAPWRTVVKAFQAATYGDTVYIRDGNYGEINNPVSFPVYTDSMIDPLPLDTQFVTFKADTGHTPVFTKIILGDANGNYYVPYIFEGIRIEPKAGSSGVVLTQCVGTRLKNLAIIGQSLAAGYGVGLGYGKDYIEKNNDIRIEDCIIHTWARGIHGYGSNIVVSGNEIYNIGSDHVQFASGAVSGYNILIENNHIHHTNKVDPSAHPDGIAFVDLKNVIFRNNRVHDLNGAQGIFDHGTGSTGSNNVLIENNLIYGVGVTELQFDTFNAPENWILRNNTIIGANLVQQVYLGGGSNHSVYNNIFVCSYGAASGSLDYHDYNIYVKKGSGPGDTEPNSYGYDYLGDWDSTHAAIEPELFVDPANKDFRLKQGCRAVDFGTPVGAPTTDILGNLRDAQPDAGCYEYGASKPDSDPDPDPQPEPEPEPEPHADIPDVTSLQVSNNIIKKSENTSATIQCSLKEAGNLTVKIYDAKGKEIIIILCNEHKDAGIHTFNWSGKDSGANKVGSGIYIVHMEAGGYTETKKIAVIK